MRRIENRSRTSAPHRWSSIAIGLITLLAGTTLGACSSDSSDSSTTGQPPIRQPEDGQTVGVDPIDPLSGGTAPNLGQSGAQDIGELRQILESGGIPAPEVLDEVGFFNVHRLTFPAPDCGEDVCLHGLLGMMGNMISGSNCTLVMLGMNTPLDPNTLSRPPVDLIVALDTSMAMTEHYDLVSAGLTSMLEHLGETDTLSLITFDEDTHLLVDAQSGGADVAGWFSVLRTEGESNLYAGLRAAFEHAEGLYTEGRQARVLLVSTTAPSIGLTNSARITEMSAGFTSLGIGLTTIGMGDADGTLLRRLTEIGAGNTFFVEDAAAIEEVFTEEIDTFIVPIAEDVRLRIDAGGDYWLGRIHGTHHSTLKDEYTGTIDIPSLFIAQRTSDEEPTEGRRGGGGAILIELIPLPDDGVDEPLEVGTIHLSYRVPGTEVRLEQTVDITSVVAPAQVSETGEFDTPSVEKGFVMLNLYVGFEIAAERAANADYLGALQVLRALEINVEVWLADNPDSDIEDDAVLLDLFIGNVETAWDLYVADNPEIEDELLELEAASNSGETRMPEPWPQD